MPLIPNFYGEVPIMLNWILLAVFTVNAQSSINGCTKLFREKVLAEYIPEILDSIDKLPQCRAVCRAIIKLLDDVHTRFLLKLKEHCDGNIPFSELYRYAYVTAWIMIMKPSADHLYGAFMTGCLPLCFMPIRNSLEAMTMSYYVDVSRYKEGEDPFARLIKLNKELRGEGKSIAKFLKKDFASMIGEEVGERALALWGKVSDNFMHFAGLAGALHSWNVSKDDSSPPSWAIGAFVSYDESDELTLKELERCVTKLNDLFNEISDSWLENSLKKS